MPILMCLLTQRTELDVDSDDCFISPKRKGITIDVICAKYVYGKQLGLTQVQTVQRSHFSSAEMIVSAS